MNWRHVSFTSSDLRADQSSKLQEEFQDLFAKLGEPADMALFAALPLPQQIDFYFSPGSFPSASALADHYGATEVPHPPPAETLGLQVGRPDARARLLPPTPATNGE